MSFVWYSIQRWISLNFALFFISINASRLFSAASRNMKIRAYRLFRGSWRRLNVAPDRFARCVYFSLTFREVGPRSGVEFLMTYFTFDMAQFDRRARESREGWRGQFISYSIEIRKVTKIYGILSFKISLSWEKKILHRCKVISFTFKYF